MIYQYIILMFVPFIVHCGPPNVPIHQSSQAPRVLVTITDQLFSSAGVYSYHSPSKFEDLGTSGSGDSMIFKLGSNQWPLAFVDRNIPSLRLIANQKKDKGFTLTLGEDRRLAFSKAGDPHDIYTSPSGTIFHANNLGQSISITDITYGNLKNLSLNGLPVQDSVKRNLHPEKFWLHAGSLYVLFQGFDAAYTSKSGGIGRLISKSASVNEWSWDKDFYVPLRTSFPDGIASLGNFLVVGGLCYHDREGCQSNIEIVDPELMSSKAIFDFKRQNLSLASTGFLDANSDSELTWVAFVMKDAGKPHQEMSLKRFRISSQTVEVDTLWTPPEALQFPLLYIDPFRTRSLLISSFLSHQGYASKLFQIQMDDKKVTELAKGVGLITSLHSTENQPLTRISSVK